MTDPGSPLCTYSRFTEGAFADLASMFTQPVINNYLLEATRQCEDEIDRRLAPFTVTETHRAEGVDPEEYGGAANIPMSIHSTLGMSDAQAIGRHHPPPHPSPAPNAPQHPPTASYTQLS